MGSYSRHRRHKRTRQRGSAEKRRALARSLGEAQKRSGLLIVTEPLSDALVARHASEQAR